MPSLRPFVRQLMLLQLLLLANSCASQDTSSPPRKNPVSPPSVPVVVAEDRELPGKKEWLTQLIAAPDKEIDLIEAVTVLADSRLGLHHTPADIPRALGRALEAARKQLRGESSALEKIDILNAIVLPEFRKQSRGRLQWIFDAFGNEEGDCLPNVLLYLISADSLDLHLEVVQVPGHAFLRYSSSPLLRNIETTRKGEHLTDPSYRESSSSNLLEASVLPEEEAAFKRAMEPISRRQLVALLMYQKTARSPEDLEALRDATLVAPEFFLPHLKIATYFLSKRDFEKCEEELSKAIRLAPFMPGPYALRSYCWMSKSRAMAALDDINVALKLSPKCAYYHFTKAIVLANSERYSEAISSCTRAIDEAPKSAVLWNARAAYQSLQKHYKEAIQDYSKAIEIEPKNPDHYEERSKMWAMIGDESQYQADRDRAKALRK